MIRIDHERCTGCGACVEVCPVGAIQLIKGEMGNHAEIDEDKCRQCEACVEACPENAIMSEVRPVIEGEVVQLKAKPVLVHSQPRQVRPARLAPKAMIWLGPTLAFVGREIIPRLAASLLDAWDRRASRSAPSSSDRVSERPTLPLAENLPREGGGRRHRQRRRGK